MVSRSFCCLPILLAKKTPLGFKGAPWYVYLVGALGIATVASTSLVHAAVGASVFLAISTAGQIISSQLIDQFGFLAGRYRNSMQSRFRAMCCWPRAWRSW